MKYDIVHEGIVKEIMGNMVVVAVEQNCACGSCRVKSLCGLGERGENEVAVYDRDAERYSVGETVVVAIGTAMGMKAVLWAYIMPFLLMLATLLITKELGATELVSGLLTLGAVGGYYACLWFARHKMEREIVFKIMKR
ncbi:MAG: SoxR reducing system RseC family protein [Rikenellaceae bacterium]|nr:SoxR reducing system RseC family protein [Rikenellaceae bacterium]MCL2692239.1 SoxR reducing system RseC family protein [Rikenellaceae bacterium]